MIDFVEYVIRELKSKRLSKAEAADLLGQFSCRSVGGGGRERKHPLLGRNRSDLRGVKYSTELSGDEFFVRDHQVGGKKVLPGVAYLEMARAAVEEAWGERPEGSVLELRETVWLQALAVGPEREVGIALWGGGEEEEEIEYEISSAGGGEEVVHCQGRALWSRNGAATPALAIERLKEGLTAIEPGKLYTACAQMGMVYGATMQGIVALYGSGEQVVAELRAPAAVAGEGEGYVLHPSLLDSALQACAALMEEGAEARVPFALESLRVAARCEPEMVAWVRCAAGSRKSDAVVKLDIDLSDRQGQVCVQMRGLSTRALKRPGGVIVAAPVWQCREALPERSGGWGERHIVVCGLPQVRIGELERQAGPGQCEVVAGGGWEEIGERYSAAVQACVERIQKILQSRPREAVLLQVAVEDERETALFAGLSGLLKTAALEHPQLRGQLILVPGGASGEEVARMLEQEAGRGGDGVIRYASGVRQELVWEERTEEAAGAERELADEGAYLITGGLGGLGLVFAQEMLSRTAKAVVVLTGRGELTGEKQAVLDGLCTPAGRVSYRQVELGSLEQVERLMADLTRDYGRVSGILHCAGRTADNYLMNKTAQQVSAVLQPKVSGTVHLDQASRELELDFFVLFSSVASARGNAGQADYAAANGFLDQYAAYRNRLVAAGRRHGRTRSINWPWWEAGGMRLDRATQQRWEETAGVRPLQTAAGVRAFYQALALDCDQMLVLQGDPARMRQALLAPSAPAPTPLAAPANEATGTDAGSLCEKTREFLCREFSGLLKLPAHKLDPQAALELYGIDSILAMKLTSHLEQTFGPLSKTLFFEYQTIAALADYFLSAHREQVTTLFGRQWQRERKRVPEMAGQVSPSTARFAGKRRLERVRRMPATEAIAVIGLSGQYPGAEDLEAYWRNLREGKDCIVEVPRERWDWREYFSEDRTSNGRHYSKWGGFIRGVDEFDPLFFNISPADAELMDPQERLFLQQVWKAVEDAGYTRAGLQGGTERDLGGQVGVYVGVMYSEYQLFGAEASLLGKPLGVPGSVATIANRVSYIFNLHGPSMTLDTMCSSSLSAIHMACQDLKQGRTNLAIAGGVNVTIHPNKYLVLSAGQFISSEGRCQSFGEGGDGYIPGEGVGVVVLKRLSEAERDGDHIYGIIRGSALNHGGKTNGYTVPNPQAQSSVIVGALREAGVEARQISYIEAHGTGTRLGDPIEIAALSKAFEGYTGEVGFCRIGSVKSNIGHCESAAGVAGLTKVLLQMQHQELVPTLHAGRLNPHIEFEQTPFVVNRDLCRWERPLIQRRETARLAGISSFGAGGSNAHMIVEEYARPVGGGGSVGEEEVILLSARTEEQLKQRARDLLAFVRARGETLSLESLAWTLQVGREAMEERLGVVVSSAEELVAALEGYLSRGDGAVYRGQVRQNREALAVFSNDSELQEAVQKWLAGRKWTRLVELWVKGLAVEWGQMHGSGRRWRMSLPTYPFARERYWVERGRPGGSVGGGGRERKHPLLGRNRSDLRGVKYSTELSGDEFFVRDHQVGGKKVLPGVAYLEMARAAVEEAWGERPEGSVLELRETVWLQALAVGPEREVGIALWGGGEEEEEIEYEISSAGGGEEVVHCQGRALWSRNGAATPALAIERLKEGLTAIEPGKLYTACAQMGMVYGATMQGIVALYGSGEQVVAELRAPAAVAGEGEGYVLHPSLLDSALQACAALMEEGAEARVPFALESLRVAARCEPEMVAWVRCAAGSRKSDAVVKLDIDLSDRQGQVCVQMRGLSTRALKRPGGVIVAAPVWQCREALPERSGGWGERHIVVCGLPQVRIGELERQAGPGQCEVVAGGGWEEIGERYSAAVQACVERIQKILQSRPREAVLLQVAVEDERETALFAGLSGLLKTAALEHPQLRGQLILVPGGASGEEVARMLEQEAGRGGDGVIRYASGVRQELVWEERTEEAAGAERELADEGAYLITGGLGGLGLVFAQEMLSRTAKAVVVLTGRGELTGEKQAVLDGLCTPAGRVSYRQVELGSLEQVERLMADLTRDYGRVSGILHCAGRTADNYLMNKTAQQVSAVLQPKVSGTVHLDQASRELELDFFVLFSSVASARGNAGQADYAAANGFLDQYAAYRNRLVAAGRRHGRTRSINWPWWEAGGMRLDRATQQRWEETAGVRPLQTAAGVRAFYQALALDCDQMLVLQGDPARMRQALLAPSAPAPTPLAAPANEATGTDAGSLCEKTREFLCREFSGLLKLPAHKLDPQAALELYGIDSILAMKLTSHLEQTFGPLSKTLFFEYQTIAALADYFLSAHREQVTTLFGRQWQRERKRVPEMAGQVSPSTARFAGKRRLERVRRMPATEAIAVIGLSGQYPGAEDLEAYWRNLREGKDCIVEVPRERWDWREYFSEDRTSNGRHYSKWGGFIRGVDEFDPLFFNISPADAELMDPQERLFLQQVWKAVEDAGYTRAGLQGGTERDLGGQVGVYVGVMYSEYQLFGAEASLLGKPLGVPGSVATIANRVSYIFNLHGPSMTLDTMCSSSLSAIHMACQDLKQGRTNLAIAGGVNVTIHPNKYLVLSAGQFISSEGRCQSFGEGGDGYIPGEGVGVVVLKRLSEAERDGDHIYGIIRGSALNHGGKTNGYTVPNPQAQSSVIVGALREAGVEARQISYIEAHGTGTRLGDPIEIAALSKAFEGYTGEVGFCRIGSVKSNIGHCESAAGVAGLTKVLLQMQHQELVPTLHAGRLNPHIEFEQTPFVVNRDLCRWERPLIQRRETARLAGISSFGAGGSNAHMIVEEYARPVGGGGSVGEEEVILLSARTEEQLKQRARDLLAFVRARGETLSLESLAWTLQVGREAMEERLGVVVSSAEELVAALEGYLSRGDGAVYRGQVRQNREALAVFSNDSELQEAVQKWLAGRKWTRLVELWVKGLAVEWGQMHGSGRRWRMSLPTYPFARERYWVERGRPGGSVGGGGRERKHPLLGRNRSDLRGVKYSTELSGDEFFVRDHQVGGKKVLPGVAYLEMARAAVEEAWGERPEGSVLELRETVWLQALAVGPEREVGIALWGGGEEEEEIEYEISSAGGGEEVVHCQGRALWSRNGAATPALAIERLKEGLTAIEPGKLYTACAQMGMVYGATMQGIVALYGSGEQVVAELRAPAAVAGEGEGYVLHPSLLDSALQACAALMEEGAEARVPFALESLRVAARCEPEMVAWVRCAAGSRKSDAVVKLDIDLSDRQGQVCVQMRGLSTRALKRPGGVIVAAPVWQCREALPERSGGWGERHIVVCGLPQVRIGELERQAGPGQCEVVAGGGWEEIGERYSAAVQACVERIQKILQSRPREAVLLQVAVEDERETALFAGLSGLLKTAALEHPQLRGQLILVPGGASGEEVARMLEQEAGRGGDGVIRYASGVRQELVWEERTEEAAGAERELADEGAYLITGGLGGLGLVFAQEMLSRTAKAVVVLTGRGELTGEKQAVLDGLCTPAGRVSYRQVELGSLEQVERLMADLTRDYGRVSGILHCAGRTADNYLMNKTAQQVSAVLQPKVSGTVHLDQASRELELDFFVLFSSVASARGNAGQADYAAANGFLDQYAAYRNRLVAAGRRHGRTRSINWPWWEAGGMRLDRATQQRWEETAGVRPLQTAAGVRAFYQALALDCDQMLVLQGDPARMRQALLAPSAPAPTPLAAPANEATGTDAGSLCEKTREFLCREFSGLLKLPAHKLDPQAALELYGIDSILAMKLTSHLEQTFGPLSKTLFFEYQTIAALADYFLSAHRNTLLRKIDHPDVEANAIRFKAIPVKKVRSIHSRRGLSFSGGSRSQQTEIAIVGVAGRYPQADDLRAFWRNLQDGRDCITEIPAERWDHARYYDPDKNKLGKSYSKWGGFIPDVDKFDPLFFNISPKEAELIDPQERLFLQTSWEAIEDAGYSKESMCGGRVGVFVGVMWAQYELFGAESILRGSTSIPSSSYASIANRVSYFFDLHGPSLALDTMCSSSLSAIHLACESLRNREINAAIAGGVNVTIHPYKYLALSQGKFVSSDGRCRSFGQGGDGYVPGEGVGAILLKRLETARQDGDHVHAVIKSSSVNHGGKTNGYTVPNPNAQAELILDALRKANIDRRTVSYIETHGTGTALGDPIEIAGLSKAFECSDQSKQFCAIGSVKSNIGHLESAAGIAAVTKALLQITHKQLVPSLHADPPNPNISFDTTPFYVQTELAEWKHPLTHPRRAGVSSFGAGGTNAHLILEEYVPAPEPSEDSQEALPVLFILSAKNLGALWRYAEKVALFLDEAPDVSLASIAYTSQIGRTAMDERLAIRATSVKDLSDKLSNWSSRRGEGELEDVFYANTRKISYPAGSLLEGSAGKTFVDNLLVSRDLERIARLWTLGAQIDWRLMYANATPARVSFPTYPFDKERCWIDQDVATPKLVPRSTSTLPPPPIEQKHRTYYYPKWTLAPLPVANYRRPKTGPILILDASAELSLILRGDLQSQGFAENSLIVVKPGATFEELEPNVYSLHPERAEHFSALIKKLKSTSQIPDLILHHNPDVYDLGVGEQVARHLNMGVYALFHLCQGFMKEGQMPRRVVSAFIGSTDPGASFGRAISGFLRTLTLENPSCLTKVVELETGFTRSETARIIRDEIHDEAWTASEIRYRVDGSKNQRNHTRLVCGLEERTHVGEESLALPLRHRGVCLITGGLGGLGLILADYLATRYQARLALIGRSTPPDLQSKLDHLKGSGAEVIYIKADVSRAEEVERAIREVKATYSEINGIIHSAGVNRDALILNKTKDEMQTVLAAKVYGAINLDLATRNEKLDLFVLFSSASGVFGNPGQSDYAYANRFLDCFAEARDQLRRAQKRSGRTLAIDWPLWEAGGMRIARDRLAFLEKHAGMYPLPKQEGIKYFEDFLRSESSQGVAFYGIPSRIAAFVAATPTAAARFSREPEDLDPGVLQSQVEAYLKRLIGHEVKLSPERVGSSDRLESFGLDSVMINRLNSRLEEDLGPLPKTLLYQYETVEDLARFLVIEAPAGLRRLCQDNSSSAKPVMAAQTLQVAIPIQEPKADGKDLEPIAIIGMHGSYPHSPTLDRFWENLKQGRDLIDLVPSDRWDREALSQSDSASASTGEIYCKWGGFLADYDKFDPKFFNLSEEEAKIIDPQERLFLESVWAAVEDAGYTRDALKKRFPKGGSADVGVFVGVTTNTYALLGPEEWNRGNPICPISMPWSIANRVSYFFDFAGPSMPVDTACSSSLVAVDLACEALRKGKCQVAIAGGVNLYLHSSKYLSMCRRRMLSLHGKCHSYGAASDGFVPGEGVGSLVLKPLSKAVADQDRIYAVIRASAFEHSGRSNGYSAPNPNSQARLISETLAKANLLPESIGYVEGHGTGSHLGDSIEVAALTQAFQTTKIQFCPLGSVKANIGHAESAAGMASIAKVILQMKHRQLVCSIHSDQPNPDIEFEKSPFYLQHELAEWQAVRSLPRRALINSFGAGGVNACVVLEEFEGTAPSRDTRNADQYLFAISARTDDRLRRQVDQLLVHLEREPDIDVRSLCYTLQVGREAFEERFATVVEDSRDLINRLRRWTGGESLGDVYKGSVARTSPSSANLEAGGQTLTEMASKWVIGEGVDWESLYAPNRPPRIALPTYPFDQQRYWVSDSFAPAQPKTDVSLHPLLTCNSSTLQETSFSSRLCSEAYYAVDHEVAEEKIFPAAGLLEMACIAGTLAAGRRVHKLTDVVWLQPVSFHNGAQTLQTSLKSAQHGVEFTISSMDDENESLLHSTGMIEFDDPSAERASGANISMDALKAEGQKTMTGTAFYQAFRQMGFNYGPAFQTIERVLANDSFAVAKLQVPGPLQDEFSKFILHIGIIDGALQSAAALFGLGASAPYVPFAVDTIEIIRPLPHSCYAYCDLVDTGDAETGIKMVNIHIVDELGKPHVILSKLCFREVGMAGGSSQTLAVRHSPRR